jgi:hypothetical protein
LIIIPYPLKVVRGIIILVCGSFMLIGGIFSLTGHGLALPFFYKLGGATMSVMSSVYVTIIGFVFVLLGAAELLDRQPNILYRKEMKEVLKSMTERSNAHPDEIEAAKKLLEAINRHNTSQEIKR